METPSVKLLICSMQLDTSGIEQDVTIARFSECPAQWVYTAFGCISRICFCTPDFFPLIVAAPSYPSPHNSFSDNPSSSIISTIALAMSVGLTLSNLQRPQNLLGYRMLHPQSGGKWAYVRHCG